MLMTNGAERVLANVRELAPAIASRAAEIEAGRRMPPDLVQTLRSIGIFRIFVPQSHGGLELDIPAGAGDLRSAKPNRRFSRLDRHDRRRARHVRALAAAGHLRAGLPERPGRDHCRLGPAYRRGRGSGWRLAGQRALAVCQRLPTCQLDVRVLYY